jgi:hypothetical protein
MHPILRVVIGICVLAFFFSVTRAFIELHESNGVSIRFFEKGQHNADLWLRSATMALLMLVGIVLGRLHSRLANVPSDSRVRIIEELREALSSGGFWRSLLGSPIVFGVTYWMSQNQPDPIVAGVLALENGFFCDVLFKRREAAVLTTKESRPAKQPQETHPS